MIGNYRTRITVQKPTKSTAGDGQRTETWSTYATLWAAREPQAGSQQHEHGRLVDSQQAVFRVRSNTLSRGITTDMRLLVEDQTLNIGSLRDPDNRRVEIEIVAELTKR